MTSYKHFVTNQKEYDTMADQIRESENGSHHLICFYAHGNANTHNFITTINTNTESRVIFIKDDDMPSYDLNRIIETAFENDKYIYIIAVSCCWNEKYKKGLTIPTISLAPDIISSLPYPFQNLRQIINSLPDNFDKEFMINWFQTMKAKLNILMNCWKHHDKNSEARNDGGYILKYNDQVLDDDYTWDSRMDEDNRREEARQQSYLGH